MQPVIHLGPQFLRCNQALAASRNNIRLTQRAVLERPDLLRLGIDDNAVPEM
jgi:hypothetical protein